MCPSSLVDKSCEESTRSLKKKSEIKMEKKTETRTVQGPKEKPGVLSPTSTCTRPEATWRHLEV
jgi:hypothetical protein